LFWTLGGKQVGKAALIGWIDVLVRAVQEGSVRIWPFDGQLESLFQSGRIVVAETYPGEFYRWFASTRPVKSRINSRKEFGSDLLEWTGRSGVSITPELHGAIDAGFPKGGDDAFDAVVGLFAMLQICLGQRELYEPEGKMVREIEGWMLSRQSQPVAVKASMPYSANSDPKLTDWLRWATESGDVPVFVKTVAEAASIADLRQYALLRPVLLELNRRYPFPR
jgi:hypothetical protein